MKIGIVFMLAGFGSFKRAISRAPNDPTIWAGFCGFVFVCSLFLLFEVAYIGSLIKPLFSKDKKNGKQLEASSLLSGLQGNSRGYQTSSSKHVEKNPDALESGSYVELDELDTQNRL